MFVFDSLIDICDNGPSLVRPGHDALYVYKQNVTKFSTCHCMNTDFIVFVSNFELWTSNFSGKVKFLQTTVSCHYIIVFFLFTYNFATVQCFQVFKFWWFFMEEHLRTSQFHFNFLLETKRCRHKIDLPAYID